MFADELIYFIMKKCVIILANNLFYMEGIRKQSDYAHGKSEEKGFTKEQLGRLEEYLIHLDADVFSCFSIVFKRRYLDRHEEKLIADAEVILENRGYSEGVLDGED